MKITVIAVGKIKESFYREALSEYRKRLSRYCSLEIREVEDERVPDGVSDTEKEIILKKEGARIEKFLPEGAYVVTLEIEGKSYTSEAFAQKIADLGLRGESHIIFVIGGSIGLHHNIKKKADLAVSFSKMTFPHQLMRVVLLEQIYRAFRIIHGEPYHK